MERIEELKRMNPWWKVKEAIESDFHIRQVKESSIDWYPRIISEFSTGVYSIRGPRQIGKTTWIKQTIKEESIARTYVGKQGLKTIMNDIIEQGKEFLAFGGTLRFQDILPIYTKQWAEKRRIKNIRAKLIGTVGKAPQWELNECRALPKEYFSPASTIIYANKVALIMEEEPLTIILIESKKLARSYRNYFSILWKKSRKMHHE